jgi:hypothetical protein
MNQMGHDIPITLGSDAARIDRRVRSVLPSYMTMGDNGTAAMSEMQMPVPENSIPMSGGKGPFGLIDMGGMFTILKVREDPSKEDGSGWYQHPAGSVAAVASETELARDGVDPHAALGS